MVGGRPKDVYMSPSDSQFPDLNLLGGDYCDLHGVHVWSNYNNRTVKLIFGGAWELVSKSKL